MKFNDFIKYQSLGNNFVVFDGFKKPRTFVQSLLQEADWPEFVGWICNPFIGIGADGVLVLTSSAQDHHPEIVIFNADGSRAENCSNGIRCIAHYLHTKHRFPEAFSIWMGGRIVQCQVQQNDSVAQQPTYLITTDLGQALLQDSCSISLADGSLAHGYQVNVGNPHFIILQETTKEWLSTHGSSIECNKQFPDRTNVEYIWQTAEKPTPTFSLLIHERGVGMTQACSSGVAACLGLLVSLGRLAPGTKAIFNMPGGAVTGWMQNDGNLVLQASAFSIFSGQIEEGAPLIKAHAP